jgi:hypothetical protein
VFTSTERIAEIRAAGAPEDSLTAEAGPAVGETRADTRRTLPEDALAAVTQLAREAPQGTMKRQLERLEGLVAAERARLAGQRLSAAREGLRFGGLTCSKLSDEGHNVALLRASLEICIKNRGRDFPRCANRARQLARDERVLRENARFHADTVVRTAQTYADDAEVLESAHQELAASLAARGYAELAVYPSAFLQQVRDYVRHGGSRAKAWFEQCRRLRQPPDAGPEPQPAAAPRGRAGGG